jgi:hypothetical protein
MDGELRILQGTELERALEPSDEGQARLSEPLRRL